MGRCYPRPSAVKISLPAIVFMISRLVAVSFSQAPGQLDPSFEKGMAAYKQKAYRTAIQELKPFTDRARQTDPGRGEAATALGLSYYFEGQFGEAIPLLKEASERTPSNTEFAYALGIACLRTRDIESAREAFARMFQVARGSADAGLVTAKMMMGERMEEFAQQELERAGEKNPRLPQLHFLLGELAIFRGDAD